MAGIRSLLTKNGGNMAEAGAVAWQFHKKGVWSSRKGKVEEDALLTVALGGWGRRCEGGRQNLRSADQPAGFRSREEA